MTPLKVNQYIDLKLTHSIHTSERLSFRACRRRWKWLFHDRWYPTVTPKPLEFGSAFHSAMEAWYDPLTWGKDSETRETLAILAFVNACNEQKAKYLTDNEGRIDPEVEIDFKERVALGEGMIRYHCEKVSPKLDANLTPLRVEIEFEVPVVDPDTNEQLWCKCDNCWNLWKNSDAGCNHHGEWQEAYRAKLLDAGLDHEQAQHYWSDQYLYRQGHNDGWQGLPVTYGGRIDCLMEDELGRLWIADWKTAARLSGQQEGDSPDEFIQLEDQITSYTWALWVLGIKVAGFIHHEMKKSFPVEPEPNKVQRKGCWYSVNKMQNTAYDLYLETISEGDPTGLASGAYDEFLDWLKVEGPRYYSRKQVQRSETELRNAGRNIFFEALDMVDPGLRIYPSPGRFGCTFCAFRQPCIGANRDEDIDYMFRSNFEHRDLRYWEKAAPSTDSKGGQ